MEKNKRNWVIILYNLYSSILFPLSLFLMGIWSLEIEKHFEPDKIDAVLLVIIIIYLPEKMLGLKMNCNKGFTIMCSIVWFWLLLKFEHYFILIRTDSFITYYCVMVLLLIGLIWSVVVEFNQDLRKHILMFPQDEWLLGACTKNYIEKRIYNTIAVTGLIIGIIFMLVTK